MRQKTLSHHLDGSADSPALCPRPTLAPRARRRRYVCHESLRLQIAGEDLRRKVGASTPWSCLEIRWCKIGPTRAGTKTTLNGSKCTTSRLDRKSRVMSPCPSIESRVPLPPRVITRSIVIWEGRHVASRDHTTCCKESRCRSPLRSAVPILVHYS